MLDIVGVGWPNVDEDAYSDMATRLLSTGQSESLAALDKHWSKVQGKHKNLAEAARLVAGALDRVAKRDGRRQQDHGLERSETMTPNTGPERRHP